MKQLIFLTFTSILLTACGGGGSSSGSSDNSLTGVFLDSPVINIDYQTPSRFGTTNNDGQYRYLQGETVTFAIGALEFPPVVATSIITPLDIAATTNMNSPAVVNMIRLLQSLDRDNNPANGIEITNAAKTAATSVSFNQSVSAFGTAITNLVNNGGQDSPALITTADANAHFSTTVGRFLPMDMTTKVASSFYTRNDFCEGNDGLPAGFISTFGNATITFVGRECTEEANEQITISVATATMDFPFASCANYPTCTNSDLNRDVSDIDGDGRPFSSSYRYNPVNGVLTSTKRVSGRVTIEEITIGDAVGTNLAPTDMAAFNAKFVGRKMLIHYTADAAGIADISAGNMANLIAGNESIRAAYAYNNTGSNTATIAFTSEGETCTLTLTFNSELIGDFSETCTDEPGTNTGKFSFSGAY